MSTTEGIRDFTDTIAVRSEQQGYAGVDRDEAIKAIRSALKRRSGKAWSVTGGRGTAWGWITIDAPKRRKTGKRVDSGEKDDRGYTIYTLLDTGEPQAYGLMTPADKEELRQLLSLETMHDDGVSIPAGSDYRVEYIARAEGRSPSNYGKPYWD